MKAFIGWSLLLGVIGIIYGLWTHDLLLAIAWMNSFIVSLNYAQHLG